MEWVTRWHIDLRWRAGVPARILARRVDTPRQLAALVAWARAHPDITAYRHHPVRELVGEPPNTCRNGHPYHGGTATRPHLDWTGCDCGGHIVYHCRAPGCGDQRHEPTASGCNPGR